MNLLFLIYQNKNKNYPLYVESPFVFRAFRGDMNQFSIINSRQYDNRKMIYKVSEFSLCPTKGITNGNSVTSIEIHPSLLSNQLKILSDDLQNNNEIKNLMVKAGMDVVNIKNALEKLSEFDSQLNSN